MVGADKNSQLMLNLLPSKFSPEEIANIRHKKNLTQKELADGIGVSKRTVEAWEVGRYNISGAAGKLLALLNLGIVSIDCKGATPKASTDSNMDAPQILDEYSQ